MSGREDELISRRAADAANKLIDRFEQILRDIRETNEDESVCGLCEYDGAFIGQSGDWCNECPGFDKADCFKLSDKRRKKWLKELGLPAAHPEKHTEERTETHACDCISRAAAIEALSTPHGILYPIRTIEELPAAQPEIIRCGDCKYFKVEHGWNCASYPICEVSPQRIIMPDDYCSFAERRTDD